MPPTLQASIAFGLYTAILLFLWLKPLIQQRHSPLFVKTLSYQTLLIGTAWSLSIYLLAPLFELSVEVFQPFSGYNSATSFQHTITLLAISLITLCYIALLNTALSFRQTLLRPLPSPKPLSRQSPKNAQYKGHGYAFIALSVIITIGISLLEVTGITHVFSTVDPLSAYVNNALLPLIIALSFAAIWSGCHSLRISIQIKSYWLFILFSFYFTTLVSPFLVPLLTANILWVLVPNVLFLLILEAITSQHMNLSQKNKANNQTLTSKKSTTESTHHSERKDSHLSETHTIKSDDQPLPDAVVMEAIENLFQSQQKPKRFALILEPQALETETLSKLLSHNSWGINATHYIDRAINLAIIERNHAMIIDFDTPNIDFASLKHLIEQFLIHHISTSIEAHPLPIVAVYSVDFSAEKKKSIESLSVTLCLEKPISSESLLTVLEKFSG